MGNTDKDFLRSFNESKEFRDAILKEDFNKAEELAREFTEREYQETFKKVIDKIRKEKTFINKYIKYSYFLSSIKMHGDKLLELKESEYPKYGSEIKAITSERLIYDLTSYLMHNGVTFNDISTELSNILLCLVNHIVTDTPKSLAGTLINTIDNGFKTTQDLWTWFFIRKRINKVFDTQSLNAMLELALTLSFDMTEEDNEQKDKDITEQAKVA